MCRLLGFLVFKKNVWSLPHNCYLLLKRTFVINHLTGRARLWGTAEWERLLTCLLQNFARFFFGFESCSSESTQGLMGLKQGEHTMADYFIDFWTRGWSKPMEQLSLLWHLSPWFDYIKDELVPYDTPTTLDGVTELASREKHFVPKNANSFSISWGLPTSIVTSSANTAMWHLLSLPWPSRRSLSCGLLQVRQLRLITNPPDAWPGPANLWSRWLVWCWAEGV